MYQALTNDRFRLQFQLQMYKYLDNSNSSFGMVVPFCTRVNERNATELCNFRTTGSIRNPFWTFGVMRDKVRLCKVANG